MRTAFRLLVRLAFLALLMNLIFVGRKWVVGRTSRPGIPGRAKIGTPDVWPPVPTAPGRPTARGRVVSESVAKPTETTGDGLKS